MTTATKKLPIRAEVDYPDSDGKPMGETARHVITICQGLDLVQRYFADDPDVYVGANMFLYFVWGDPKRNVCPDLFVVKGVPKVKHPERRSYRTWEENGKGPDAVVEYTSKSTRREDTKTKMALYQNVLKVREYYLFDPYAEYLRPPLQGYRRVRGAYVAIKAVRGRLPSRVLGLHLENCGNMVRYWDPAAQAYLLTPEEMEIDRSRSEEARQRAEARQHDEEEARKRAEAKLLEEEQARKRTEAENERLQRELDELRKRSS